MSWEDVDGRLRVVRLTLFLQTLVPPLILSGASKSTRGISLYPGRTGAAVGATMLGASLVIGVLLSGIVGPVGLLVSFWLLGGTGALMMVNAVAPIAFVKPICVRCRLLPIIREHEAIHLSGVVEEKDVWASMKSRHTVESLHLAGDPAICSFCPIPKRLSE